MRTASTIASLAILTTLTLGSPANARPNHPPRSSDLGEILPHPSGCPRIAFCGCGVSVRVFGHPIRNLFAAAAYHRYPRTNPRPGAVAIWSHHVAYIESVLSNGNAMLYDPNSGRHLTRRHEASLQGAVIVDPNGNLGSPHQSFASANNWAQAY